MEQSSLRRPLSPTRGLSRLLAIVSTAVGLVVSGTLFAPTEARAEVVATCRVRQDNPHHSGHFPLTINAIGRILWCKGRPVPDLHLDVRLVRWTGDHWAAVTTKRKVLRPGKDLIRISRATYRCVSAFYATETRLFGFGRHKPWKRGNVVFINCGAGGGAGGGGGGGW